MIEPANIHLQLRQSEFNFLMMAFESGLINLDNFSITSQTIFGTKNAIENARPMMEKLAKLREELIKQYEASKKKSAIYVPDSDTSDSTAPIPDLKVE